KLGWILADGPRDLLAEALERLEWIADAYLSVATPVQLALPALLRDAGPASARVAARIRENARVLRGTFPAGGGGGRARRGGAGRGGGAGPGCCAGPRSAPRRSSCSISSTRTACSSTRATSSTSRARHTSSSACCRVPKRFAKASRGSEERSAPDLYSGGRVQAACSRTDARCVRHRGRRARALAAVSAAGAGAVDADLPPRHVRAIPGEPAPALRRARRKPLRARPRVGELAVAGRPRDAVRGGARARPRGDARDAEAAPPAPRDDRALSERNRHLR